MWISEETFYYQHMLMGLNQAFLYYVATTVQTTLEELDTDSKPIFPPFFGLLLIFCVHLLVSLLFMLLASY